MNISQYISIVDAINREDLLRMMQILYNDEYDFSNVPYEYIVSAQYHFYKFKNELIEKFPALFTSKEGTSKEKIYNKLGLEDLDDEDFGEEENEVVVWYKILYEQICNSDYLRMEKAYKLNIYEVFNFLSFKINKTI